MNAKKLGYIVAVIAHTGISLTLAGMTILQIAGYRVLTLRQVVVAMAGMLVCEARIGGQKK